MKVKQSNKNQVKQRLDRAFQQTAQDYSDQNQTVIREPRQWPSGFGTTHRRSGEVVSGSNRNIVDLGNLANSQNLTISEPGKAQLSWDGNGETPAPLVHEGYVTSKGNRVPARKWTRKAAQEINLSQKMADHFSEG